MPRNGAAAAITLTLKPHPFLLPSSFFISFHFFSSLTGQSKIPQNSTGSFLWHENSSGSIIRHQNSTGSSFGSKRPLALSSLVHLPQISFSGPLVASDEFFISGASTDLLL
jgi:hypothetical protein